MKGGAKAIMAGEAARGTNDDCPDSHTSSDFNDYFGKQLVLSENVLKRFESLIRNLKDIPQPPGSSDTNLPGMAGPSLTPAQTLAEFEQVEAGSRTYRDAACSAAFHQFDGGTGGPSFRLECEITLTRNHIWELNIIHGEVLLL